MILLKNGHVMDPKSNMDGKYDLLIHNHRIEQIAETIPEREGMHVIDASGKIVAPGLVDVHVHFRDPGFTYKEDIYTGAAAAKAGGFTSVICMANTRPVADNEEILRYVAEKGRETGIHIYQAGAITMGLKGETLTDMEELVRCGAPGFTDDGIPILKEELVREAMEKAARLHVPLSFHEEDPTYIQNNGINEGVASRELGIEGSKRQAEISLVERDLKIAAKTGATINIQHISTREAVELVRQAKKTCNHIHAEATPHHFALTEEAVARKGTMAKMNPPLRSEEDRQAIIEGLRDGTIDIIATDHAPHAKEEKERPFTEAPSGIIGLETALATGITSLVGTGCLTMMELLKLMTQNPAELYQMEAGYIVTGGPADLVVFDPQEEYVVSEFASKSTNSPFLGEKLCGRVHYTIADGALVYNCSNYEYDHEKHEDRSKE